MGPQHVQSFGLDFGLLYIKFVQNKQDLNSISVYKNNVQF